MSIRVHLPRPVLHFEAFLSCCYSVYARRTFEEPEEDPAGQVSNALLPSVLRPFRGDLAPSPHS